VIRVLDDKRDGLKEYLNGKGIATGLHYPSPIHLQQAYAHLGYREGDFPVAERFAREILSLPMFAEISDEQIDYVANNIRSYFRD
jgi:dTDP-4-amino-4,6-dideoxygalactose transaminase